MAETTTAPTLDDETHAALTLYNEYVKADRERSQREKRVKKSERAKEEAAALVKKLSASGSAEDKAAADAAYREANDAWRKLRDGEEPEPAAEAEATPAEEAPAEAEAEATPAEEAPAEATPADDDGGEDAPTVAVADEEE